MRIASHIVAAMLFLLPSCVRVELDNAQIKTEAQALRVSRADSVVLCPISAAIGPSGTMSIVWAGYPPADDRLQLLHAIVSADGFSHDGVPAEVELLQSPRSIALLGSELAALEIRSEGGGLQIQAVQDNAGEILAIELDESGVVLGTSNEPLMPSSRVAYACESTVLADDARFTVFRSQVDGDLPLFVENTSF